MAVITFSRHYASGGDEIAAQVGETLGYRYFDKRLIAQYASESALLEGEPVDFSEENYRVRGFLERLFGSSTPRTVGEPKPRREDAGGAQTEAVEALSEEAAIVLVQGAILEAYKRGGVVIVGRGAQVVLRDKPGVLHVRVEAPLEVRLERVQKEEKLGFLEARDFMAKRDRASSEYLQRFYKVDWRDLDLYNVFIDMETMSHEEAVQKILAEARRLEEARLSG